MIPNTSFAVSNVQVSQLPIQCSQIEGYYKGAALGWLQVHDSCIAPGAGAVPLWEMPVNPSAQFQETLQVARLNLTEGLFVGVSSTEGTWTASASTMDVTVWTDMIPLSTNAVGDRITSVYTQQIWSQATGAASNKKLYQLIVTEQGGVNSFICIYAEDNPSNLTPGLCLAQIPLAAYTTVKLCFGTGQGFPNLLTTTLGTAIPNKGCTVATGFNTRVGSANYGVPSYVGYPASLTYSNFLAITN